MLWVDFPDTGPALCCNGKRYFVVVEPLVTKKPQTRWTMNVVATVTRRLRLSFRRSQAQVDRLQAKLSAVVEERSAAVDEEVHGDLVTIMQENKAQVLLLLFMAIVHVICKARHIVRFYFMHIIIFVLSCQKMRGCSKWALDPFLY